MNRPRGLLIDIDGVLYQGEAAVPGAAQCLRWVIERGIPHCFITNTTSKPRRAIVEKLAQLGIETDQPRIHTPLVATSRWLAEHAPGPCAAFVPEATRADLDDVVLLNHEAETGAASVVVGDLGDGWSYATLNRAFRLLMAQPTPVLVALGMTRYWRAPDGLRIDVAAYVRALECAAGVKAVVLGKPAPAFFVAALDALGITARESVMIGDDIVSDVNAAQALGITGILVRTGKFQPRDLKRHHSPDAVLDSIAELPQWWSAVSTARPAD
jgi:phospholysine phosphohistidine inorganic pyrophosphate phosphatase